MQIGIRGNQKKIRELIADKVKMFYPKEDIVPYRSGQEILDAMYLPDLPSLKVNAKGKHVAIRLEDIS